jgi:hypothetical protein
MPEKPILDEEFVRIALAVAAGIVIGVLVLGAAGMLITIVFATFTFPGGAIAFPVVLLVLIYGCFRLLRRAIG